MANRKKSLWTSLLPFNQLYAPINAKKATPPSADYGGRALLRGG